MGRERHQDGGERLEDFLGHILVVCPRCGHRADVLPRGDAVPEAALNPPLFLPRRLICQSCGVTRDWQGHTVRLHGGSGPPRDAYFQCPLYLVDACGGQVLWAYNLDHLSLIERHVRATLRQHQRGDPAGWGNGSLVNRLPRWMILAKNRRRVLAAIARLREKARLKS